MTKEKLSRREFLHAASTLAAGSLLAACAPKATSAPPEQGKAAEPTSPPAAPEGKLIRYWTGWGGDWSGWRWNV